MIRPRRIYMGVLALCILCCWNTRFLYVDKDETVDLPDELVRQIMVQNDSMFDSIGNCTCEGENAVHTIRDKQARNSSFGTNPHLWTKPNEVDLERALIMGHKREYSGFLTIGIPTVQRQTEVYLTQTLDSLIQNSTPDERLKVILLLFLADFEEKKRSILKKMMNDTYYHHIESGFIQVIEAPTSFYPTLENLKLNYGDSKGRVLWRSKQCVDFAFMFFYAERLSEYYMQIEDDVITAPRYISAIRQYIQEKSSITWFTLEFSVLGFIGKLFHSYDLDRFAQFTMFFYQDLPVDLLLGYYRGLNAQKKVYNRKPSLFQHKGEESSLSEKKMPNVHDKYFDPNPRQYMDSDNPPGKVYSNMTPFQKYVPQLSYSLEPGFFWAKKPQENDSVVLVFDPPTLISRVAIVTGSEDHPADMLEVAVIELSSMLKHEGEAGSLPECTSYVEVGRFVKGVIDLKVNEIFTTDVACLRIHVLKSQIQWAIIREIAVWARH